MFVFEINFESKVFCFLLYRINENNTDSNDENNESDIDDNALAIAIKGDSNEINHMITDLYKAKSKLKMPDAAPASKVENSNGQPSEPNNAKRKSLPVSSNNSNKLQKTENVNNMTNMEKLELLKQSQSQNRKPTNASSGLTKSLINFEMFACDQDLKENIFRRIYYILSPEHFLSNGKIPPRGFLLHGILSF